MDALLLVVGHPFAPGREPGFGRRPLQVLLGREPGALVVFGRRVLRQLGERHVGVDEGERRGRQLVLERLEPGQIGAERHHPEVGLVAEHGEHEGLVTVVDERLHRVGDALPGLRIRLRARAVDLVEEVEHAPSHARFDRIHDSQATGRFQVVMLRPVRLGVAAARPVVLGRG